MPTVILDRYDCEDDRLPQLCMVCSEETEETVPRTFSWHPQWITVFVLLGLVGIIIAVILMSTMTKKQKVNCPMCAQHRNHWFRKNLWLWAFAGLMVMGIVVAVAVGQIVNKDLIGMCVVGGALFSLTMLIMMAIVSQRGIRPKEITDDEVILKGVHEEFRDAYDDKHERHRRNRRRRRLQYDDDDDGDDIDEKEDKRPLRRRRDDED